MEEYDVVVVGNGEAGKYLAWTLAKAGHRTALVERSLIDLRFMPEYCLPPE
jgi:pyruvate/2-oxoglutarate dehydrogenase complex dihydrolipoamide dehydrogenase (E3) component